jgi:lysophospholipase L1-like esterase
MGSVESHFVVVALGDSLTAGYRLRDPYAMDPRVPYSAHLETMMRVRLSELSYYTLASVVNAGVNGDSTDGMLKRFKRDVAAERPDVVVIWGGLNDLSVMRRPDYVLGNLFKLYEATRALGAEPIACTLTPMRHTSNSMRELNELIRAKCIADGMRLADLFPQLADSEGNLMAECSDDGVHLTIKGYNLVAHIVYDSIRPILDICNLDQ